MKTGPNLKTNSDFDYPGDHQPPMKTSGDVRDVAGQYVAPDERKFKRILAQALKSDGLATMTSKDKY